VEKRRGDQWFSGRVASASPEEIPEPFCEDRYGNYTMGRFMDET